MEDAPAVSLTRVRNMDELGRRWRALEATAQGGFFRSWTYLATLLPHVRSPLLLAVQQSGQDVALGLFSRRGFRLYLHETGHAAWDRLYVEHNGLLVRRGAESVLPIALTAALQRGTLVLSGVDAAHEAAARDAGAVETRKIHRSPAAPLRHGGDPLNGISANARQQIRRAMRLYGPSLAIERATTISQALMVFDELVVLHQASWRARGQRGAFNDQKILRFHAALIREGVPRGEVTLLRVAAGARTVGCLYHFEHGRRVFCYQSGFAMETDPRLKPGLVCHALAMDDAQARGLLVYDLLAGVQRYKTTLAPGEGAAFAWLVVREPLSWGAWWCKAKGAVMAVGKVGGRQAPPPKPSA